MREFYQAGRRSSLTSPMFNVPGRMTVGGEVYFRHLPALLRELTGWFRWTSSPGAPGRCAPVRTT